MLMGAVQSGVCKPEDRAAGRGAGDVERDFWLAFELLRSPKDHAEFTAVRDWIAAQLRGVCADVSLDRPKSVLKQGAVQHLYARLSATLRPGCADAELLVRLTVCCRPMSTPRIRGTHLI